MEYRFGVCVENSGFSIPMRRSLIIHFVCVCPAAPVECFTSSPSIPNENESCITMPIWRLCVDANRSQYFIRFSCLFCVTMPNQWSFFFSSNHLFQPPAFTHSISYYSSLLIRLKSIKSISNNTQTSDSAHSLSLSLSLLFSICVSRLI